MSQIVINTFTSYQQTDSELIRAMTLSPEQQQFLQTQIAKIAEERIALTPDPVNYAAFIQQEAYLKGQIDFVKYLLDCHTDAINKIKEAAETQQQ
jgi:hypothetical protein